MPEYSHTLIPSRHDFVPEPEQVGAFLSSLAAIGAAPEKASINVATLSGKVETVVNPFTGETVVCPQWVGRKVKDTAAVPGAIKTLDDYDVTITGKGPPKLPAFAFDFNGKYDFLVQCSCRKEVVSMSDWHDEAPVNKKVEFFGRPCGAGNRIGIFHNPTTLEIIEVANAGCAKFWVEFEFGKMLFPRIVDRLDLIAPAIVTCAEEAFGLKFVQGCHWCG